MGSRHISWYTLLSVIASLLLVGCSANSAGPSQEATTTVPIPSPTTSPATGSPVPAASPATSPAATPEEVRSGKTGDTLWNKEWRITLDKIERPGKTLTWSQPDGRAEAKGEYVLAYLSVQKTREGNAQLYRFPVALASRGRLRGCELLPALCSQQEAHYPHLCYCVRSRGFRQHFRGLGCAPLSLRADADIQSRKGFHLAARLSRGARGFFSSTLRQTECCALLGIKLAGDRGFEPRHTDSESLVQKGDLCLGSGGCCRSGFRFQGPRIAS